jgi:hypothetical protein
MDEFHYGHGLEIKWSQAVPGNSISEAFFRKTGMWPKMSPQLNDFQFTIVVRITAWNQALSS